MNLVDDLIYLHVKAQKQTSKAYFSSEGCAALKFVCLIDEETAADLVLRIDLVAMDRVLVSLDTWVILARDKEEEHHNRLYTEQTKQTLNFTLKGCRAITYHFPSTSGENVLVLLIPVALHDFSWMRLPSKATSQCTHY